MKRFLARIGLLVFFCAFLFLASGSMAQTGTSTIRGEVSDTQGKLVAGATVTLKSASTGFSRSQSAAAAGGYSFDLTPPGDYTLDAEAEGFNGWVRNVSALSGSVTAADVQVEVGVVSEVVQVEGTAAIVSINTEDATIGNTFVNEQITQLPMEARNVLSLLTLQPGVTYAIDSTATTNGSVNGARSDQSNVTLDGADINEAQTSRLNTPVLRLNSEAIEEFRVTTLNANSNQGRSSAAQVNLVTKSGTNSFHGAAFEFNRSTGFTSNDFFLNRIGQPRPALIRNTFGGGIGGPIVKNKLFFFYSYEGRRDKSQGSVVRTVPLPTMGQGMMNVKAQDCPTPTTCQPAVLITYTQAQLNNIFPAVGLNPAGLSVLAAAAQKYPANDFTVGDSTPNQLMNTAGFRFSYPVVAKLNSSVAKFDANISSKQTLFVRLNYIVDHSSGDFAAPQFPDTPSPTLWSHPWGFVVGHTWTISKNLVNNLRYGLTREAFSQIGDHNGNQFSFRFVFDNVTNNPATFTTSRTTPVHNILDDVAWIKNRHTIQMGTNIRIISNNRISNTNAFDFAQTNPSGYQQGGNVVSDAVSNYLAANGLPAMVSVSETQNAGTALIGRFSQYSANLT